MNIIGLCDSFSLSWLRRLVATEYFFLKFCGGLWCNLIAKRLDFSASIGNLWLDSGQ